MIRKKQEDNMNAKFNELNVAIDNLRRVSEALDKYANRPENYNSSYAQYLETLSWDMFRHANDIERIGGEFYV
jgi:hypothetical protein